MLPGAQVLYGIGAVAIAISALLVVRQLGGRGVGPMAVLILFASWALFVWLTPLGPHLWRASALGFLLVGAVLVASFLPARGVSVVAAPRQTIAAARRRTMMQWGAVLVLLMFSLPLIAHLAAYGRSPLQR